MSEGIDPLFACTSPGPRHWSPFFQVLVIKAIIKVNGISPYEREHFKLT